MATEKKRKREVPRLSEFEWDVMKAFWERGPMAARDVYAHTASQRGWAYETVKTMLSRLVKKGALVYEQIGNSFLYRPAYTREEMTESAAGSFVERVFDGRLPMLFAHFVGQVSEKELEVLQAELARLKKAREKGEPEQ